jgi:hypothetical protein
VEIYVHFEFTSERLLVGENTVVCVEDGIMEPDNVVDRLLVPGHEGMVLDCE